MERLFKSDYNVGPGQEEEVATPSEAWWWFQCQWQIKCAANVADVTEEE